MSKQRIACTAITGRIFIGQVNKDGDGFVGRTQEVTSDVLKAIEDGKVFTEYCTSPGILTEWAADTFTTEGFGPRRVHVPEWALWVLPPDAALAAPAQDSEWDGKSLPYDWVACQMLFDGPEYPEDYAYGPPRMMNRLRDILDRYFAWRFETKEPAQDGWIPVSERLPESGKTVLASYFDGRHNYTIRARYIGERTQEAYVDDEECEYDEDREMYFVLEGWYESINNWGDYSSVAVTEGEVTHWQPLPNSPAGVK